MMCIFFCLFAAVIMEFFFSPLSDQVSPFFKRGTTTITYGSFANEPPFENTSFFFPTRRNLITNTTSQTNSALSDVKASRSGPRGGKVALPLRVGASGCVRPLMRVQNAIAGCLWCARALSAGTPPLTALPGYRALTPNINTERTMNTMGEVINGVSSVFTIRFSSCFLICFPFVLIV